MPPLILHNVPDDELYIGEDGVQRPYAMLYPGNETTRTRRTMAETGSFGKSTRRSRTKSMTREPLREDPTLNAADALFSAFFQNKGPAPVDPPQRKNSMSASIAQPNMGQSGALIQVDGNPSGPSSRHVHKDPTEVILRGFKSNQAYAAIREYERIGGRICEDYPRDAPETMRKYKSDLRDQASMRSRAMTPEEKAKALKFAGGDHWIKITFESAEAATIAIESSPQTIHGHVVYAEAYRGIPPTADKAEPSTGMGRGQFDTVGASTGAGLQGKSNRRGTSTLPRSFGTPSLSNTSRGEPSLSPSDSHASSYTLDSNTLSNVSTAASSATITGFPTSSSQSSAVTTSAYCHRIPTAKRMTLLPAEQALLPQQSYGQRVVARLPIIGWFTGDIIGSSVPRTESGEFDWVKASTYWKIMWWIDSWTGLFEIVGGEKEE